MPEFVANFTDVASALAWRKRVWDGETLTSDHDQMSSSGGNDIDNVLSVAQNPDGSIIVVVAQDGGDNNAARLFTSTDFCNSFTRISAWDSYFDSNKAQNVNNSSMVYFLNDFFFMYVHGSNEVLRSSDGLVWTNLGTNASGWNSSNVNKGGASSTPFGGEHVDFGDVTVIKLGSSYEGAGSNETYVVYTTDGVTLNPIWDYAVTDDTWNPSYQDFNVGFKTSGGTYVFPQWTWTGPGSDSASRIFDKDNDLTYDSVIGFHSYQDTLYAWSSDSQLNLEDNALQSSTDFGANWDTVVTDISDNDYPAYSDGEVYQSHRTYAANDFVAVVSSRGKLFTNSGTPLATGSLFNNARDTVITQNFGKVICGVTWTNIINAESLQ